MEYVKLGASGLSVSRICLGMMSYGDSKWRQWVLDEEQAEPIVRSAVEAGIIFYDTADMYSLGASESVTGRLLGKFFRQRDDYVVATKAYSPMGEGPNDRGLSRKHLLSSVDNSLRRLGTDHIDLYQIHRWDDGTPIEETLAALHEMVRAGKVRYIGASSMFAWQFAKAQYIARRAGWTQFISMQNHYNLLYREEEREMIPLCQDLGVGLIPWSPLARGLLTRWHSDESGPDTVRSRTDRIADDLYDVVDLDVIKAVHDLAQARDESMARIALAWLLHKPAVAAPIVGATRIEHLADAIAALDIRLSADELAALEAPYRPHPVRGHG